MDAIQARLKDTDGLLKRGIRPWISGLLASFQTLCAIFMLIPDLQMNGEKLTVVQITHMQGMFAGGKLATIWLPARQWHGVLPLNK